MTSVLGMQFYSMGNKSADGRKGIGGGALVALSRHNMRDKIDYRAEVFRSKRRNMRHINSDLSKKNIHYKMMDFDEIKKIKKQAKETNARSNSVGAFQLFFDFDVKAEGFDTEAHKEMILDFLKLIGVLERFILLEMVFHFDEERQKPHCHLIFSGYDKIKGKFAVNDFFSPKGEKKILKDEDGNTVYKRIKSGKKRGEFELDADGHKIPRMDAYRRNGAQWMQDSFASYLSDNNLIYSNKKEYASSLQFKTRIWRRFDDETKDAVYYFRALEDLYIQEKASGAKPSELKKIEDEMVTGVLKIMGIAREIEEAYKENNNYQVQRR